MDKKYKNLEKVKIILLLIIAVLLLLNLMQKSGIIKSIQNTTKKMSNNGEIILEDGEVARTVNASNWDTSKVTVTKDADGKEVPVPKGYVGSSAAGENKINEGYVIYEGSGIVNDSNVWNEQLSRNQWVWVPVSNPNRIYEEVNGVKKAKLYHFGESGRSLYENTNLEPAILPESDTTANLSNAGLIGMTPDKFYQELQKEFDSTIESIKRYGGFYIGRYETGNLSQTRPVVKRMNTDINNQTWYTMYSKMGYLAANSNVKTNIIWGCLWDETMQWLVERVNVNYRDLEYSSRFSNSKDATFSYYNGSSNVTKPANSAVIIPTGSTEYTKTLNIYDLAGNEYEWTLEGNGTKCREFRGGANCLSLPICERDVWQTPSEKNRDIRS